MDQLFKFIEQFGIPAALATGLIIWAYYKDKRQEIRYDKVCSKINEVQDEQRKELLEISLKAIIVQAEATAVQKEFIEEFRKRPCIARVE